MEKSIVLKNLPRNVYVAELCDKLRCFGNITSATIHFSENVPSGKAYVEFEGSYSALTAAKVMNNTRMGNRSIQVSLSCENEHFTKVFVKNFNPKWDECDLLKAFDPVGSMDTVHVFENCGKSNGCGYVKFYNHYTAKRAIECMNGKEMDGYKLLVERYQSKTERDSLKQNSVEFVEKMLEKTKQYNNLVVLNLPTSMKDDELETLFENFGEIISAKIAVDENGDSKGFGFVCFENIEDAGKALKKMNGYPMKGKRLKINYKEDGHIRKQYYNLKRKEKDVKIKQYKERSKSMPKFLPHPLQRQY